MANMCHHAKFHVDQSNRCRDMTDFRFFKTAAVSYFGFVYSCFTRVSTTHEKYLVVFVIVQDMVRNGAVVSIFCTLDLKMPIHTPKILVLWK